MSRKIALTSLLGLGCAGSGIADRVSEPVAEERVVDECSTDNLVVLFDRECYRKIIGDYLKKLDLSEADYHGAHPGMIGSYMGRSASYSSVLSIAYAMRADPESPIENSQLSLARAAVMLDHAEVTNEHTLLAAYVLASRIAQFSGDLRNTTYDNSLARAMSTHVYDELDDGIKDPLEKAMKEFLGDGWDPERMDVMVPKFLTDAFVILANKNDELIVEFTSRGSNLYCRLAVEPSDHFICNPDIEDDVEGYTKDL